MECSFEQLRHHAVLSAALGLSCLLAVGCDRHPDYDLDALQKWAEASWMPADAKERIQEAMTKYQNGVRDPEPLLIVAGLSGMESDGYYIHVWTYDEDEDVLGCIVREEPLRADDGQRMLEEYYPTFIRGPIVGIAGGSSFPGHIRKGHERKDVKAWADYPDTDFERLEKELFAAAPKPPPSDNPFEDPRREHRFQFWEDTLPPVWISIPEPNHVKVWVSVYDKAGRKSNEVELLDKRYKKETE